MAVRLRLFSSLQNMIFAVMNFEAIKFTRLRANILFTPALRKSKSFVSEEAVADMMSQMT